MKQLLVIAITSFISVSLTLLVLIGFNWYSKTDPSPISDLIQNQNQEKPLDPYSFPRLFEYVPKASRIEIVESNTDNPEITISVFTYTSQDKKISGQIHRPAGDGPFPVVLLLRGFVEPSIYYTGLGTRSAAEVFANNGYITFAPDFLGYGQSDDPDEDSFAARVKRPIDVLDLIESIKQLEYVDADKFFIWGHSNGGQIALSVLEIGQFNYPTTLWAPVTKPFPYSILFYTDEYSDYGKGLRKALYSFEYLYDADKYSIVPYLDRIKAPLQLHSGGKDEEVPINWSNDFVALYKKTNPDSELNYYVYPDSDHNLRPDWNTVIQRDLEYFKKFLND